MKVARLVTSLLSLALAATLVGCPGPSPAATPEFSPAPGEYAVAQSVTITSATSGALLRYTLDGTDPSASVGTLYGGPVQIAASTTIRAVAYGPGLGPSAIAEGAYVIGAPAATPTSFPPGGTIQGTVVDSAGGAPVSGATVTFASSTATTDSRGRFTLHSLPAGASDIVVSKAGRAGSRLQAVEVAESQTTSVDLVQTLYDHSSTLVTPPTIAVSGLSAGQTYSGTVAVSISVSAGSSPVVATSHPSIAVRIGSITGYGADQQGTGDTLNFGWDTTAYPPGDTNIEIVAYDNNNNRSELDIPVVVADSSGAVPAETPSYNIVAVTYGKSLELFRQAQLSPNAPYAGRLFSRAGSGYSILSAENDSTILVQIMAEGYGDTTGIAVYRSQSEGGPFLLAGKTTFVIPQSESQVFVFGDTSSALTAGQTAYYKVAYFNQYGEGPQTSEIAVPILHRYNVELTSPSNNSTIETLTPTLEWLPMSTSNTIAGAQRYDEVVVTQVTTGFAAFVSFLVDQTSVTCTSPLSYNTLYQWNVASYYGLSNEDGSVVSVAFAGSEGESSNGWRYFSVVQQ